MTVRDGNKGRGFRDDDGVWAREPHAELASVHLRDRIAEIRAADQAKGNEGHSAASDGGGKAKGIAGEWIAGADGVRPTYIAGGRADGSGASSADDSGASSAGGSGASSADGAEGAVGFPAGGEGLRERRAGGSDPREELAIRALEDCRVRLMMAFRFLDRALWQMPLDVSGMSGDGGADGFHGLSAGPRGTGGLSSRGSSQGEIGGLLACDGVALHADARRVLRLYRRNPDEVARAYLHAVLHCVFQHPFHTVRREPELWSLACDICVEAIAVQLCDSRFALPGDRDIVKFAGRLEALGCALVPAQVYRALLQAKLAPEDHPALASYAEDPCAKGSLFARDSHELWDLVRPAQRGVGMPEGSEGQSGDRPGEGGEGAGASSGQRGSQDWPGDGPGSGHASIPAGFPETTGMVGRPDAGQGGMQDAGALRPDQSCGDSADDDCAAAGYGDVADAPQPGPCRDIPSGADGLLLEWADSADADAPDADADTSCEGADGSGDGDEPGNLPEPGGSALDEGLAGDAGGSIAGEGVPVDEASCRGGMSEREVEAAWQAISRQVEADLQTFARKYGDAVGHMMDNLHLANRSAVDYEDFLRRFCTRAEETKVNDEEFDYLFYTFGLNHYGNMPIIEPLEYKEDDRLREFVVAIDTSGSCAKGLVDVFLTRTCEILEQANVGGDRVNIRIIQCDAAIQDEVVVTHADDLRNLAGTLAIRGFGGTDFRPVFAYVDELVARGEFRDLRGMVYFTDGFGKFPDSAPNYDVAFVFVESEGKHRRVPPWACKVIMTEDEIEQLDAQP